VHIGAPQQVTLSLPGAKPEADFLAPPPLPTLALERATVRGSSADQLAVLNDVGGYATWSPTSPLPLLGTSGGGHRQLTEILGLRKTRSRHSHRHRHMHMHQHRHAQESVICTQQSRCTCADTGIMAQPQATIGVLEEVAAVQPHSAHAQTS
jgi:hypothetical protein